MTEDRAWRVLDTLAAPLLDPGSRTWAPALAVGALVAAWTLHRQGGLTATAVFAPDRWAHPSTRLDLQLLVLRRLLRLFAVGGGLALSLGVAVARGWTDLVGPPPALDWPEPAVIAAYTVALFVAWDLSRYLLHRAMHEVPALWELHQVHHSAEVLTPLAFHRIHPLEGALYGLRGAVVTGVVAGLAWWACGRSPAPLTVLGVHAMGLGLNVTLGNLRHSHIWLTFPPSVEAWLISPAQHQLHHSADPADHGCNYGTWLALWDRLGGTWRPATTPPARLGVHAPNHDPHDLVSALIQPALAAARRLVPLAAALALVGPARAQEPAPAAPAEPEVAPAEEDDLEVIVESRGGLPRVAGSAYVIDAEELERQELDDIQRVLVRVPGVYVRTEDGYGLRPNIGMRGGSSDRSAKIALLEDGIPLAPAPYAAPAAYYFPMTTRLTGVEVIKGPAAIRHGPQTIGGAINLLTRPVPTGSAGQLDAGAGLYHTFKLHGWAGTGTDRGGLVAEAVHLGTRGFKQLDGGGDTGFDREEAMLKARVALDAARRHALELKAGYSRERSNETYVGLAAEDFAATPLRRYAATALDQMNAQRSQFELRWTAQLSDAVELRTTAWHHYLDRTWARLDGFADGPALHGLLSQTDPDPAWLDVLRGDADSLTPESQLDQVSNHRRYHTGGGQTVLRWRATAGKVTSQLEVGLRLMADDVRRVHTSDRFAMTSGTLVPTGAATELLLDSRTSALAFAAHVHEDLAIGPLRLLPGLRAEVIRTSADDDEAVTRAIALPGVGVLVDATPWLSLLGGVHRGFSPLAPGEAVDARPETAWNSELGARVNTGSTQGELVGFLSAYDNLTGQCTLSGGCSQQDLDRQLDGGAAFVWGTELLITHRQLLPAHLALVGQLSYTWTGSAFRTGFVSDFPQFGTVDPGDHLPYVPEHQGGVRLTLEHRWGSATIAASFVSPLRDVAGQGPIPVESRIPTTAVLDLAADARITRAVSAYLSITNLTNTPWLASLRPAGARSLAPIQGMLGVKLTAPPPR
jgi:Fe(3+) dicitrate transport protein